MLQVMLVREQCTIRDEKPPPGVPFIHIHVWVLLVLPILPLLIVLDPDRHPGDLGLSIEDILMPFVIQIFLVITDESIFFEAHVFEALHVGTGDNPLTTTDPTTHTVDHLFPTFTIRTLVLVRM
jgi:hypothetical protein